MPATVDTFDAGRVHNALLYYILTHYDTVKYASSPNKFSLGGFDSLAALFIADSLQPSSGSFTSSEIEGAQEDFDTTFSSTSSVLTHSGFVVGIDTAVARGFLASDEASFLINADTDMRLCASYAQLNDTINSLKSQWSAISWTPSTSSGAASYGFLSVASHSSAFWGQPGDTIIPIAVKPIANIDAEYYPFALAHWQWVLNAGTDPTVTTEAEVLIRATVDASAESAQAAASQGGGDGCYFCGGQGFARIVDLAALLVVALILL